MGRPPEARGMSSDETHMTRSVPLTPRPAKVPPINWIIPLATRSTVPCVTIVEFSALVIIILVPCRV